MKSLFLACLICITHLNAADIVVNGGVPCGIAASIVAAREGAKVVLIEPTKHVHGLSSSGVKVKQAMSYVHECFGKSMQQVKAILTLA